jgi:hypothetical protein
MGYYKPVAIKFIFVTDAKNRNHFACSLKLGIGTCHPLRAAYQRFFKRRTPGFTGWPRSFLYFFKKGISSTHCFASERLFYAIFAQKKFIFSPAITDAFIFRR